MENILEGQTSCPVGWYGSNDQVNQNLRPAWAGFIFYFANAVVRSILIILHRKGKYLQKN
jgi:hypothetical protein